MKTLAEKFEDRVVRSDGCWEWLGNHATSGYARVSNGRRAFVYGHRLSYELFVGPIPESLTLDHLCRNRGCVNPAHLEPVTRGENVLRGAGPGAKNAAKTHCVHGHEFTVENTYVFPNGKRHCRECGKLEQLRYREKVSSHR